MLTDSVTSWPLGTVLGELTLWLNATTIRLVYLRESKIHEIAATDNAVIAKQVVSGVALHSPCNL